MKRAVAKWLTLMLACGTLQTTLDGAVVRGNVVEHQTGKSLVRALVILQPIAGTPGPPQRALTNRYGVFEFGSLRGGVYVVKISKPYFLPVEYGQKRWNSAGTPVVLDEAASIFLNVRLPRYGAITVTVLDDNDVGLPGHDVVAYRNTRPPQAAQRARTDERGLYRIYGLEPGAYVVRTLARLYEEGGYLPTYSPATASVDDARILDVDLDRQVANADLHPLPGKLLNLSGAFTSDLEPDIRITVPLISEMGRETTQGGGFQFNALTPGAFELFAQGFDPASGALLQAAYVPVQMVRDQRLVTPLQNLRDTQFDFQGAPVYLEGYDPDGRKRLTDLRVAPTDTHGLYRFEGLAPGSYRILATFEYLMPDAAAMDEAAAKTVRVQEHGDLAFDLDLYVIR